MKADYGQGRNPSHTGSLERATLRSAAPSIIAVISVAAFLWLAFVPFWPGWGL